MLDLLDGEPLCEGGSLLSLGFEFTHGDRLLQGSSSVSDPDRAEQRCMRTTLAYRYGLLHTLQVGVLLPYFDHERTGDSFE